MQITEFETADLEPCANLLAAVFNSAPWDESWQVSDARVRIGDIFGSPKFIGLVIREAALLGFVVGNVIRIEGNNIFELKEMCVRLKEQQRGVGSKLMDELKKRLP